MPNCAQDKHSSVRTHSPEGVLNLSGICTAVRKIWRKPLNYFFLLLTWLTLVGYTQTHKALPDGVDYAGDVNQISDDKIEFLYDITYLDTAGVVRSNQEIFDSVYSIIETAEDFILVDMFLFNDWVGRDSEVFRPLTDELTTRLIQKKEQYPNIQIDLITDPINTVYGGSAASQIKDLESRGINVVVTDLTKLRDSNPLYSSFWRTFIQWFGNSEYGGLFPHPFSGDDDKVTLRSYLDMLNFKANHRKLILADYGESSRGLITSANPHDGSSAHSNVALMFTDVLLSDIFETEQGVARFSESDLLIPSTKKIGQNAGWDYISELQLISEKRIKDQAQDLFKKAQAGDQIDIAMFYFSERDLIKSAVKASKRGAAIRLILDPNKDAFGYEKIGIPNRQVAHELTEKSHGNIEVRWYDTHGEQFHSKLMLKNSADGTSELILGSANMTRRNLRNYNLETNIFLKGSSDSDTFMEINDYFDMIWSNRDGNHYTVDYVDYSDSSWWKTAIYRFQEAAGTSSF